MKHKTLFVTGGLGFIGGHFVTIVSQQFPDTTLVVIDKNTYAANPERMAQVLAKENVFCFEEDIVEAAKIEALFARFQPDAVVHFAAESHVDNSIHGPEAFLQSNVVGTFTLLEAARKCWMKAPHQCKEQFEHARFYHISTDEVFGSLGDAGAFSEQSNYAPNSPYSVSKAAADHWVRSYFHTYGLPTLTTQCSNNYGPYQHGEKLIPTIIRNAVNETAIPLYGDGQNVRDWLYVEDHCEAILMVLSSAPAGATYTIGGNATRTNLELCTLLLEHLDRLYPRSNNQSYAALIEFVNDRPGHDYRYAIDARKIREERKWTPKVTLEKGLEKTILHYLKEYTKR